MKTRHYFLFFLGFTVMFNELCFSQTRHNSSKFEQNLTIIWGVTEERVLPDWIHAIQGRLSQHELDSLITHKRKPNRNEQDWADLITSKPENGLP